MSRSSKTFLSLFIFCSFFCVSNGLCVDTKEVKVYVEAVDSIDFPTVTAFFRVLDLNPDKPYTKVEEGQVKINGSEGGVSVVSGSFDVKTRPISIQFMADASGSMTRTFPAIQKALQDFAQKMGSYQNDADEVSIALFADAAGGMMVGAAPRLCLDWTTASSELQSNASTLFGTGQPPQGNWCSAIWNAFNWGAERCAARGAQNHLPRMVLAITDGKDDPQAMGNLGMTTQILKSTGIPCFVIGAGDGDPSADPRYPGMVINREGLEQIATSSEGALMTVTGTANGNTFSTVDDEGSKKIKGYMDKIIESYKNIYRISFKASDMSINTGELREITITANGGEGKGYYLPPVVVDEDAFAKVKYPVPESMRETLVKKVVWTTTYHKGFEDTNFETPRPNITPLIDQPEVRENIEVLSPEELTLRGRYRIPTQQQFLKQDELRFEDLAEPHFRYGVKISPFKISHEELLQGKLIGAFPVYVRDTTPPNIFVSLRSRDVPEGNEVAIIEDPNLEPRRGGRRGPRPGGPPPGPRPPGGRRPPGMGFKGHFDAASPPDERKVFITAKGRNFTSNFDTFEMDGMLVPFKFAPETPGQFGGSDAFFVFEDVRLRLMNCAAQDNISFASPAGREDPKNLDYTDIVKWYDYIKAPVNAALGRVEPKATVFPISLKEVYDIKEDESTFLPRVSRQELLEKTVEDGGKPGICWYLERGLPAEYVENSEHFTEWIERGENVRDEPGYPYVPGRELYFRVIARDLAGNETDIRFPIKVLKTGWKSRTLAYRNQRVR